ncbi:hypothetical protein ACFLWI_00050 [Chloroflexota bacterium]
MNDTLIIILMVFIAGATIIFIPQWRIKHNIPKVIQAFKENDATDIKNARTLDELGLKMPRMMDGLLTRRDYKRHALKGLIDAGIIQSTEDGRLYLSEEKLIASNLYKPR